MARIEVGDARAWAEPTKLNVRRFDLGLLQDIETQVLARVAVAYPSSYGTWVSSTTTPALIKTIIAMKYVAWFYNRQYSEDESNTNDYARLLEARADDMLDAIIVGTLKLVEVTAESDPSTAAGYPNDQSSALCPTDDDPSLGPAKFSMGTVF